MATVIPFSLTVFAYLLAAGLMWRALTHTSNQVKGTVALAVVAIIGNIYLIWQHLALDHFEHITITTSLSSVAVFLAALVVVAAKRKTGLLLRPVIMVFAAVAVTLMVASPTDWGAAIDARAALVAHVVISLLAYAVLMLATLYAVQLLYLSHLLKHHKSAAVSRHLPPLLTIEQYFFRLVTSGAALLVLALLTGFLFLEDMFAQGQAHKTILSSVAAVMYIAISLFHGVARARGKGLVIASVIASVILTLAYFGSRFVKDILLGA